METFVYLYSNDENQIENFLEKYYQKPILLNSKLEWEKAYQNPIEIADIIGTFIDNNDKYKINMWISLDKDLLINVTDHNADKIIRYLFERYPY